MSKKVKKKIRDPIIYKDLQCDSIGEFQFLVYLEELQENGFVESFKRGESYLLSDSLINSYVIQLKTTSRPAHQTILMGHSYTLDFEVKFTEKARGIFFDQFGEKIRREFVTDSLLTAYTENKPIFDFNNMGRLASINIKWMWEKHKIYVNMIKNDILFKNTFIPKKLISNKNGSPKSYKYKVRTLEEFLNITK